MSQPFQGFDEPVPASDGGNYVDLAQIVDHYVLIRVRDYLQGLQTAFQDDADAVVVDMVVLNPNSPEQEVHLNQRLFQGRLIRDFKTGIGKVFVGRIVYGERQGRGKPPYEFKSCGPGSAQHHPRVVAFATNWLQQNPQFLAPAQQQPQRPQQPQQSQTNNWGVGAPDQGPPPAWATGGQQPATGGWDTSQQSPGAATGTAEESMMDRLRRQGQQGFASSAPSDAQAPF